MSDWDETRECDVVVVGGGIAAICAAIQAGRLGCRTILIEKDQVLGGNGGPLLGVHISDGHSFHPYAATLGVIGEIIEEAAWQRAKTRTWGQHYSISRQFELVLRQKLREAGVEVFCRTYGRDAETSATPDGRRRIDAVIAEDTARYKTVRLACATGVIDGSGDGHVALRAGASFRRGREAASEFGERSAPAEADEVTLGTSITALCRKASRPVEFIPPPGTPPFEPGYGRRLVRLQDGREMVSLSSWHSDDEFCFLWMTETGGQLDTIDDEHAIHEELTRQLYSGWAELKRRDPAAVNWELTWVSPKNGKRESRRFVGDVILTQTDVEEGREWPDAVCFGGYAVDIHNPSGEGGRQVTIEFYSIPPLWSMPYRTLYSRDVANLWLAGRLCSVSHLGLGSWRLQRTLAGGGQAVGVAVALAQRHGVDNRGVHDDHLAELQQTLLREDASILGVAAADPADLAPLATVTASSEEPGAVLTPSGWLPLDNARGVQLWDWPARLEQVRLRLRNDSGQPVELPLRLAARRPEVPYLVDKGFTPFRYQPVANRMEWGWDNRLGLFEPVAASTAWLPAGFDDWLTFDLGVALPPTDPTSDEPRLNLWLPATAGVVWAVSDQRRDLARRLWLDQPDAAAWSSGPDSHLFDLTPRPAGGAAAQVVDGVNRRWSTNPLHAWRAAAPGEAWLQLTWDQPHRLGQVRLAFDTLTRAYREMPYDCDQRVSPMCVADYRLLGQSAPDAAWQTLLTVSDNYHRHRVHTLDGQPLVALRLQVDRVWDNQLPATVYEVRVYPSA